MTKDFSNKWTYTKDEVIRYPTTHDPKIFKKQREDFLKQAQAGKVICISDLIGSAEEIYFDNYLKSQKK